MNEEEKKKALEDFDKNVQWLRNHVPRDDIYDFAEQALMAADFFIGKWSSLVDLEKEIEDDKIAGQWLQNVVGMRILKQLNAQGVIDTEWKMGDKN